MTLDDEQPGIGLRIARSVQKILEDDGGTNDFAFDIVLRNGSTIECVWEVEIEDGLVRTNSAVSVAKMRGLAYAFPADEIALARPHRDRPSAGDDALRWGRDALNDPEINCIIAIRMKSGLQITQVHSIDIEGRTATVESTETCDSGVSHIIAVDEVETVWIHDSNFRKVKHEPVSL